jgi:copper chaperone CopZ
MKTVLTITGMHCKACQALIEEVCNDVAGVVRCTVNLNEGHAEIVHERTLNFHLLKQEIERVGPYKVTVPK